MKAKYIGCHYGTEYNRHMKYLTYEYRGMQYDVYINMAKGNEPLAWQHRSEQNRIDQILDTKKPEKSDGKPIDWDEIWAMLGYD